MLFSACLIVKPYHDHRCGTSLHISHKRLNSFSSLWVTPWTMVCMKCCGQCGFPSEPRGWQQCHDSFLNNCYVPLGAGDLTWAPVGSSCGASDVYFSPPSVTFSGLSWEGKVIPGLSAQPTPHNFQQWKMYLPEVSGDTISFTAVRAVTTRNVSCHLSAKWEDWHLLSACCNRWVLIQSGAPVQPYLMKEVALMRFFKRKGIATWLQESYKFLNK